MAVRFELKKLPVAVMVAKENVVVDMAAEAVAENAGILIVQVQENLVHTARKKAVADIALQEVDLLLEADLKAERNINSV
jgi:hypothetical protein